jgi:hypothetical protein
MAHTIVIERKGTALRPVGGIVVSDGALKLGDCAVITHTRS